VGDVGFQRKCKQRIEAFTENGVAILFVSHNMVQVNESCSRALWLEQGRAMAWGNTSEVTDKYQEFMKRTSTGSGTLHDLSEVETQ
jgi:lipopolysaccharide transport system ATP-binding protein